MNGSWNSVNIYFARWSGCEVLWWVRLCVCVCLSVCPRSLPIFLWMLPITVARFSSASLRNSKGKEHFWGFSSPMTMHCTAEHLGHAKRLNLSWCRLGWWVGLSGTVCYVVVTIPEREGATLGENICPRRIIPLIIENWTGTCSGTQQGRRLIASVERVC